MFHQPSTSQQTAVRSFEPSLGHRLDTYLKLKDEAKDLKIPGINDEKKTEACLRFISFGIRNCYHLCPFSRGKDIHEHNKKNCGQYGEMNSGDLLHAALHSPIPKNAVELDRFTFVATTTQFLLRFKCENLKDGYFPVNSHCRALENLKQYCYAVPQIYSNAQLGSDLYCCQFKGFQLTTLERDGAVPIEWKHLRPAHWPGNCNLRSFWHECRCNDFYRLRFARFGEEKECNGIKCNLASKERAGHSTRFESSDGEENAIFLAKTAKLDLEESLLDI